jgi:hypothetical protein
MRCIEIAQTPIHGYIPDRAIDRIDKSKDDEKDLVSGIPVNAEQAESHIVENTAGIFAKIDKMRKYVLRVAISSETLKSTPNRGQRCKKTQPSGMARVANRWIVPRIGIKAKEEFNILKVD